MAEKGMDVEQVRSFGNNLRTAVLEQIKGIQSKAQGDINALDWKGPDADQFRGDRLAQLNQAFGQVIAKIEELASTAINNANAQDQTSTSI